jgi:hypothetical protein
MAARTLIGPDHEGHRAYFTLLLIIALLTSIPCVYRGLPTGDAMQYAGGLEEMLTHGFSRIGKAFNSDLAIGYYLVIYCLMKVLGGVLELSVVMNLLSAFSSVVLQLILFTFFHRLTQSARVAFFTCMATLLAPSIWMHAHFGHPVLPAVSLFASALLVLDTITGSALTARQRIVRWTGFLLLSAAAAIIRLDIILAYGAFVGLLFFRRSFTRTNVVTIFAILTITMVLVFGAYRLVLGTLTVPGERELLYHVENRLNSHMIISRSLKNVALFVCGMNVVTFVLALVGFARVGLRSRLWVLVLAWLLPWCVFLPFQGMDFSRIAIPAMPPLILLAIMYVDSIVRHRKTVVLAAVIIAAQLAAAVSYYPVTALYPFQEQYDGRVIAGVPLGFPPADQAVRQQMIIGQDSIAQRVAGERQSNVLIVSFTGRAINEYWLHHTRTILEDTSLTCDSVAFDRLTTPQNTFFVVDLTLNAGIHNAGPKLISSLGGTAPLVHIGPYSTRCVLPDDSLFRSTAGAIQLLRR